jgi:hypothetical protein
LPRREPLGQPETFPIHISASSHRVDSGFDSRRDRISIVAPLASSINFITAAKSRSADVLAAALPLPIPPTLTLALAGS